ncbi:MAG: hypothetical protein LBO81_01220 [Clostridiales Family XIII bacterium]|jgi:hypothetical protein|nr:hypothetical protein [Clostridiales Family XIII bacterium]
MYGAEASQTERVKTLAGTDGNERNGERRAETESGTRAGTNGKMNGTRIMTAIVAGALLVMLAVSFGFAARSGQSGGDTPGEALARTLDALKRQSPSKLYVPAGIGAAYADGAMNEIAQQILEFEYEIGGVAVRGDRAEVNVTVRTYPLGEIFEKSMEDFLIWLADEIAAEENAEADGEEPAVPAGESETAFYNSLFEGRFRETLSKAEKNFERTVTVTLLRTDGGVWVMDPLSPGSGILDAVYGGMPNAASRFGEKAEDRLFIRAHAETIAGETVRGEGSAS